MREKGATEDAAKFTEMLRGERHMSSFREFGKVDLIQTTAPRIFNDPNVDEYVLVNGVPPFLQPYDNTGSLDLTKDPLYTKLKEKYPNITVWPMCDFNTMEVLPGGGQRFVFTFPLMEYRAQGPVGSALVAFDFGKNGEFNSTQLLKLKERID